MARYEIVERDADDGGHIRTYSGYTSQADALEVAEEMAKETPDSWFEVREERR